jgi:hypothetical protein
MKGALMRITGSHKWFFILSAVVLSLTVGRVQVNAAPCPCDIYAAGGTPCVAAHSTVRALYSSYNGYLYQIRRADSKTKDIGLLTSGGLATARPAPSQKFTISLPTKTISSKRRPEVICIMADWKQMLLAPRYQ